MNKKIEKENFDHENFLKLYNSFIKNKESPFVLDGQNYVFNLPKKVQKDGLRIIIDQFSVLHHPIFLILPSFLITRYKLTTEYLENKFTSLIRIDNNKLDDWGILDLANQTHGFIISNDNFRKFRPYYDNELFSRLVRFVVFSIDRKIFVKIPFIEFFKLQTNNQTERISEDQENDVSSGVEILSS